MIQKIRMAFMQSNLKCHFRTLFPLHDEETVAGAIELTKSAKEAGKFTDVYGFKLKCLNCQKGLKGQTEAQQHAKETGHGNFGEIS